VRAFYNFLCLCVYLFIFANSKHSFFSVPEVESVEILSMTGPVVINSGNDVTLDCYYNYRYGTSCDPQRKRRHNGLLL
jgi:hypothetical protein